MTAEPERFTSYEAGLALSPIPVWVLDVDSIQICWANDAALDLWQAQDRAELYTRDVLTAAPQKVLVRLQHVVNQVRAGKILREEWAFYPRGKPTMVLLHLRAVVLADGRMGMLNQALHVGNEAPPSLLRAITTLRHLSVLVVLVDAQGVILTQNPAAMAEFGDTTSWITCFVDPLEAKRVLQTALAGQPVRTEATVRTRNGERWHVIEAHMLRDPVSGELGVLLQHKDDTARIEAERTANAQGRHIDELSAMLELVERQRREILALSAPIIDVGDRALVLPIIGRLEEEQGSEIMTRLMAAIVERRARHTIMDLTGLAAADGPSAGRLLRIVRAIRLLGSAPMITGVRSELARMLVDKGLDLAGVSIRRSLADGLRLLTARNRYG